MKVVVMGYGQYGQALGSLLEHNNVDFTPVDIGMPLTHDVDVLFQVVPTQFLREAMRTNARYLNPKTIVVNAAKGIEKDSHKLPHQIVKGLNYNRYYSLMGPSFADGILAKDPTLVSLGYSTEEHVDTIKELIQTPFYRIQPTPDYMALELSGAMKNVYAILCGYADGLGLGANTRAKLITLSLQEIVKLGEAMGLSVDILASGIVGDLVLTCSSPESRNYQFGRYLAKMSPDEALKKAGATVEGYHTSQSIQAISREFGVGLPVATLTQNLIENGIGGKKLFHDFFKHL